MNSFALNTVVSGAKYNLILVTNPQVNQPGDFDFIARQLQRIAPDIQPRISGDRPANSPRIPAEYDRPTMTFSPGPLRFFRPWRGRVFQGAPLHKHQEYEALENIGITVPRWALLTPDKTPDMDEFGPYVIVKPDRSGRGADVKIKRKGRVRWRPPKTNFTKSLNRGSCDWIVQEFIYTGPWPVSYRVTTLFGEPLWAWRVVADRSRRRLEHRYDFRRGETGGGMSAVSSGKGCVFSLSDDPEILALARRAHQAFPEVPLLGVDVLRDVDTGRLCVIEVNTVGFTWHFSSPVGIKIQRDFGFDLERQFDGRRKAAGILAEQVRRYAC